jgi:hypothetical protein
LAATQSGKAAARANIFGGRGSIAPAVGLRRVERERDKGVFVPDLKDVSTKLEHRRRSSGK